MAIEAEALLALSEKASQGEWRHCQPFMSVPAENTVHGRLPAQRVDYVSTWPGLGTPPGHRVIIPMEGRECHVSSDDMAFIAALVSAYRDGSLIHRSALAEDTARAAEGWEPIETAPRDGTIILLFARDRFAHEDEARGKIVETKIRSGYFTGEWWSHPFTSHFPPTHWRPLPAPPALPLDKEAADANR